MLDDEMLPKSDQYSIKKLIGQGSFSTLYSAFDKILQRPVAMKIERPGKSKKILKFESEVLQEMQGVPHYCKFYEYVSAANLNSLSYIVMQLLGKDLSTIKEIKSGEFSAVLAIKLLLQMLEAIENLHNRGYIHRDIKPANFVLGRNEHRGEVYLIDFGLAKIHKTNDSSSILQQCSDFKGTWKYASVNAHRQIELNRGDDMWSFYFVIMDFLNQSLPWGSETENAGTIKAMCLANPEKYLWNDQITHLMELKNIFYSIQELAHRDNPDYGYIHNQLIGLLEKERLIEAQNIQVPIYPFDIIPKKLRISNYRKLMLSKKEEQGLTEIINSKISRKLLKKCRCAAIEELKDDNPEVLPVAEPKSEQEEAKTPLQEGKRKLPPISVFTHCPVPISSEPAQKPPLIYHSLNHTKKMVDILKKSVMDCPVDSYIKQIQNLIFPIEEDYGLKNLLMLTEAATETPFRFSPAIQSYPPSKFLPKLPPLPPLLHPALKTPNPHDSSNSAPRTNY